MKPVAPKTRSADARTRVLRVTAMAKPKRRYSQHIYRVVKQVPLDGTEYQRALDCLNGDSLTYDGWCDIAAEAARLCSYKRTTTNREVHHELQAIAKEVPHFLTLLGSVCLGQEGEVHRLLKENRKEVPRLLLGNVCLCQTGEVRRLLEENSNVKDTLAKNA